MTSEPHATPPEESNSVEMPQPTVAPLVLALGLALVAAGLPLGLGFLVTGAVVVVAGLGIWIAQVLPGRGHIHEPLVEPERRPAPVTPVPVRVERLQAGMPGYRLRLPEDVRPISAGIWGGLAGGAVMPVPAVLWGVFSGHGIWYPVNLLAGMVLPGVGDMDVPELEQFHGTLFAVAIGIHVVMSVVLGLIYGVLLPTLPSVPRAIAWGGLLMPLLWTATSYLLMGTINPVLAHGVSWPWFIASQFVYGIAAATVITASQGLRPVEAGLCGGVVGGLLMPIPAVIWSVLNHHSVWYPLNLLAGMVVPDLGQQPPAQLELFHAEWLGAALGLHVVLSLSFAVLLALVQRKLPTIPGPVAWGGLVLPLLWTGTSYALMGVVNPVLQERVDWAWFVVSQFVFGVTAAVVVLRWELVHIPPAGTGPG